MKTLASILSFTLIIIFGASSQSIIENNKYSNGMSISVQNQDITVLIDSLNISGLVLGDTIIIPVRVTEIEPGSSIQTLGYMFTISFDKNILTLHSVNNHYEGFVGAVSVDLFNDSLRVEWLNPLFCCAEINEGESFFDIIFTYNGGLFPGDTSFINWDNCKIIDGAFFFIEPLSINGFVYLDALTNSYTIEKENCFFQVWSNNKSLYIDNSSDFTVNLFLYDLYGRLIESFKVKKGLNSFHVFATNNIYFVKIQYGNFLFTKKIFANN